MELKMKRTQATIGSCKYKVEEGSEREKRKWKG
jgi:hypothetical protein